MPLPEQKPTPETPFKPEVETPSTPMAAPSPELAYSPTTAAAGLGGSFAMGYLDNAIPETQFRLRYDSAYRDNRPDRAEFFYAKCGCFRVAAIQGKTGGDIHAAGPTTIINGMGQPEKSVDYQDITGYLEVAADHKFSAFLEVPFRFLNPEVNANTSGFADMFAGVKYAILADPNQYFTFMFRTAIPTGDSFHGLGTDHVSLEPGLLYWRQVTDKLQIAAELRDWIPIGGSDFAGNVLRYGIGAGYEVYRSANDLRILPILEFVGWTVLSGKESDQTGHTFTAAGDEIINIKFGVRTYFGAGSSVYVGYGRALTGDVWYKDIIRAEYRLEF
jgi:hypothetical protein